MPRLDLIAPLVLGSACALVACSAAPDTGLGGSTPEPGAGNPTKGDDPPASSSGGTPGGSSSSGGTSSGGSSGGGSSGILPDDRLFPAEMGRTWTYAVEQVSQGQKSSYTSTTTITGQQKIDGRDAWAFTSTLPTATTTSYADVQGDDIWIRSSGDPTWMHTAKAPVAEGASWTYSYYGTRQQTWHKVGAQTVGAGVFTDCWRIDYVVLETSKPGDVNYSVICRGVGTVLVELEISNGFKSRQELSAKSF